MDGHGVNSWALHFYLIRGLLRLFLQLPWGGAYSDVKKDRDLIQRVFDAAARLIPVVDKDQVTMVVSFYGNYWEVGAAKSEDMSSPLEMIEEAIREIERGRQRSKTD